MKITKNKKKDYEKEQAIYNFLNKNLKSNIQIPKISYSYITDELALMGYKKINGKFLNPKIYATMTKEEQNTLKLDIAKFLKELHNIDYSEISQYVINNKQNIIEKCQFLKDAIYDSLTAIEKEYIESFLERLQLATIFNDKKCLCHNDLSCNHLLLDDNNKLVGIIDFGDAGITDEYCDFIYLLEESEEEIGVEFGEDILRLYGDIDILTSKEYQEIIEQYYPIETIIYGLESNRQDFIKQGKKEIEKRYKNKKSK